MGAASWRFGIEIAACYMDWQPSILSIVEDVLSPYCDNIQLNLTQAIETHLGALSQLSEKDAIEYMVDVMWPFSPYIEEAGATLIWPGSHGERALDVSIPDTRIVAECGPGDALLFLG